MKQKTQRMELSKKSSTTPNEGERGEYQTGGDGAKRAAPVLVSTDKVLH